MSSEWIRTTIGDQIQLQRGIDITKRDFRDGTIPVVSSGGVGGFHDTPTGTAPGVILGRKGVVGSVYYLPTDYWAHDTTLWVKDFKGNHPRYVYYFFKSIAGTLRDLDVGSANPTLNRNHVHPIETSWASFAHQKAIAHILGTLDDKIELNRKTNETLEAMARALFKSWFVDFDPVRAKAEGIPTGLPDEISDLFPDSFEDSDLGEIPRGWEVAELGDCDLDIESGRRPKGGIDKNLTFGIPSIGAESIAPVGQFDYSKTKLVGNDFAESSGKGWIQNFDVALYKDGGKPGEFRPRTALYGDGFPFEKAMVNEHIFLLRSAQLGQSYLYYLFNFDLVLAQIIHKGSSKGAQPGLNQEEVRTSSFVKPEKRLLDAFNNAVEPSIKKQLLIGKQCQVLSQMRDALLPKLISGEIRIPDAERLLEEVGV
jgi:type I restriction enzyme S subunit